MVKEDGVVVVFGDIAGDVVGHDGEVTLFPDELAIYPYVFLALRFNPVLAGEQTLANHLVVVARVEVELVHCGMGVGWLVVLNWYDD